MDSEAENPYNRSALADVILRSSDSVDFYVLAAFLRYVSPAFSAMFSLSNEKALEKGEKDENEDKYPIVTLTEDSQTTRLLLDSIYPREEDPPLNDVSLFWKLCKAVQKYCMDIVERKLRKRILASNLIGCYPLRVYAIATDLGWEDVAVAAARGTLQTPLQRLGCVDELGSIPGSGFYRFLEYRLRCDRSSTSHAEGLMKLPTPVQQPLDTSNLSAVGSAPFDSSAAADLILRSSDSVDFFVMGALVRRVSIVFDSMFPLQGNDIKNGCAVICVAENSRVLHCLLSLIYHDLDEPDINQCQPFIKLVLAAREYKMTVIEKQLHKQVMHSPLVSRNPLRIYAVATALGWEDSAKMAALNTLYRPLEDMRYFEELTLISGADLYRLVWFRFRCADAADGALRTKQFADYGFGKWCDYYYTEDPPYSKGRRDTKWMSSTPLEPSYPVHAVSSHPGQAFRKLRDCPRGSTITDIYSLELRTKCAENQNQSRDLKMGASTFFNILRCAQEAASVVEDAVSEVNLSL